MKLLAPERTAEGYKLGFSESAITPELSFDGTNWIVSTEWMRATDALRLRVLGLLFEARNSLFKTSPSQKTLELLWTPWVVIDVSGTYTIKCQLPLPESQKNGKGVLGLVGVLIKRDVILPLWAIQMYTENTPVVDFDWDEASPDTELREVTLFESESTSDGAQVIHLQTDEEYTTRKFVAKERVKEARLKAILARRAAEVETNRYFNEFSFADNESTFSEYDISDFSEEETEEVDENSS